MIGWAQLVLVFGLLREKLGWTVTLVASILMIGVWFGYSRYQEEVQWHTWASHWDNHKYSEVVYEDGKVRVKWDKLPVVPNCGFTETWHMYVTGRGWIPIISWEYNKDDVPPYRKGTGDETVKDLDFWGQWVKIPMDLSEGKYEIRITYEYDCWNWGVNTFSPYQHIIFEVK